MVNMTEKLRKLGKGGGMVTPLRKTGTNLII